MPPADALSLHAPTNPLVRAMLVSPGAKRLSSLGAPPAIVKPQLEPGDCRLAVPDAPATPEQFPPALSARMVLTSLVPEPPGTTARPTAPLFTTVALVSDRLAPRM